MRRTTGICEDIVVDEIANGTQAKIAASVFGNLEPPKGLANVLLARLMSKALRKMMQLSQGTW